MIGALSAYQQYDQLYSVYGAEQTLPVQKIDAAQNSDIKSINSNDVIEDKAIISDQAKALYEAEQNENLLQKKEAKEDAQKEFNQERNDNIKSKDELTQEQKQQVAKLERTDASVKAHEQAHKAAAGGLNTSAASYEYETGPDGKKYAVAGEVSISYPKSTNPETNLQNAKALKAAALAPADPSSTDKAVARKADAEIAEAQKEIEAKRLESKDNVQKEEAADKENNKNNNTPNTETIGSLAQNGQNSPDVANLANNLLGAKSANEAGSGKVANAYGSSVPINSAESVINPSAKPVYGAA